MPMSVSCLMVHTKARKWLYPACWCTYKHANGCIQPAGGPYTHGNTCIHQRVHPQACQCLQCQPVYLSLYILFLREYARAWNSVSLTVLSLFRSFQGIVRLSAHFLLRLTFFSATPILSAHAPCTRLSSLSSAFLYFTSTHSADEREGPPPWRTAPRRCRRQRRKRRRLDAAG